jgi:hypothetical protein
MAFNTKLNLTDAKFYQADGGILTLSGDTKIPSIGTIAYVTQPVLTALQLANTSYVTGCTAGAAGAACSYAHAQDAIVSGATLSCANDYTDIVSGATLSDAESYANGCDTYYCGCMKCYTDTCVGNCTITAENGIHKTGTVIGLGGALTGDSTITCIGLLSNNAQCFLIGNGTCSFTESYQGGKLYIGKSCHGGVGYLENQIVLGAKGYCGYSVLSATTHGGITFCSYYGGCGRTMLLGTNALIYGADYSACYTDRSLVDKAYVATLSGASASAACAYAHAQDAVVSGATLSCANDYTDTCTSNCTILPTNGLNMNSGRCIGLGGTLTGDTVVAGSFLLGLNATTLNLTGATVNVGGPLTFNTFVSCTPNLLCVNTSTGAVGVTSLSAFGGITGATNGLCDCGDYRLGLGGALSANTSICGGGAQDLCLGTSASKLDYLFIEANCACIETGNFALKSSGATFTDLNAVTKEGIKYAADYSLTYDNRSLVDKEYVDTVATGLKPHDAVWVATTAPVVLSGSPKTIDGISVGNGKRVLVKDQAAQTTNGIYVVASGVWSRSTDYDFTPAGEVANGDLIPVSSGSTENNTIWVLTTPDPIVSGVTGLVFGKFASVIDVTAGAGIAISQVGGVHTVCVSLGANSGLDTNVGLVIGAGCGLSTAGGVLNVNAASCGSVGAVPVGYNAGDCLVVACSDILGVMSGAGTITGATNGIGTTNAKVCLGGSLLTGTTTIIIPELGVFSISDTHASAKAGITYAGDYSASFVGNSLVSKTFVTGCTNAIETNYICAADNGLHKSGNNTISLGGTLTGDTCINGGYGLYFGDSTPFTCFLTQAAKVYLCGAGSGNQAYMCLNGTSGRIDGIVQGGVNIINFDTFTGPQLTLNGCNCTTTLTNGLSSDIYLCCTSSVAYIDLTGIVKLETTPNAGAACDAVLVRDAGDNQIKTISVATITGATVITAINGLHNTGQIIGLGGALTGDTQIGTGAYGLGVCSDSFFNVEVGSSGYVSYLNVCSGTSFLMTADENIPKCGEVFFTPDCAVLVAVSGSCATSISAEMGKVLITGTGGLPFCGAVYGGNYNANFVCRSLVDAAYVTGLTSGGITTADNGLTKSGQNVSLGGALTGNTVITGAYLFGVNVTTINLTGSTVNIGGAVKLTSTPATGLVTDSVLVRASDGTVKVLGTSSNNIYTKTIVTVNTTLTTGSSYVILVSGATTITLPTAPIDGQAFKIKDASLVGALTNNITIDRNGKNIDGAGTNATINTDGGALEVMYDATRGWSILSFVN